MADLDLEHFLPDVVETPASLQMLVSAHAAVEPLALEARRVLFVGMGSSRFAALNAAAYLRSLGHDAHAEHASSGAPQPPEQGLLVVAVSAGGGSAETIAVARRHRGTSTVIGVTNRPDGALTAEVDTCLDLHAGEELSGVACRSYTNTLALLLLLCGVDPSRVRAAADASAAIIDAIPDWLGAAADVLSRPAIHVLAPAERLGSAEQSALMLREVPRVRADACETGDWSHVDVYLSKLPGLGLVLLRGSAWEAEVMDWALARECPVVTVGGPLPGAAVDVPIPGVEDPVVRMLAEVRVCELLAADFHRRHGDRLST
ncbi:MAG TPA: SIS domain-containing protein [Gaiellales bacterium]|nr:SIS domain-containing protein [Gaiellales bacterium]